MGNSSSLVAGRPWSSSFGSSSSSSSSSSNNNKVALSNTTTGKNGNNIPGSFTANGSNVMLFGAYLEPRVISKLSHQAKSRKALDIKRVSLLSCCSMMAPQQQAAHNRPSKLILQMTKFLQKHAPNLEWLLITGPLLLETNAQACQLLNSIPKASLKRLCLNVGQPASMELGQTLVTLVQTSPCLEHLNLNGLSWFSIPALQALAPALPSLKWLDMTGCRITDDGFSILVQALIKKEHENENNDSATTTTTTKLETLNLMSNSLSSASLKEVALLLSQCSSLTSLNMSHMPLFSNNNQATTTRPDDVDLLVQAIAQTTTLQELNLSFTHMSLPVMTRILQAASQSPSLTTLHLSGNRITPQEALQLLTQQLASQQQLRISSLYVQHQQPPPATAPQQEQQEGPQPQEDGQADNNNEQELVSLQQDFLQALHSHYHLTHLSIVASKSNDAWWNQAKAILNRNLLAQRLDSMITKTQMPSLAVWPQYLQNQKPALTYQVLQRHMSTIMTTAA